MAAQNSKLTIFRGDFKNFHSLESATPVITAKTVAESSDHVRIEDALANIPCASVSTDGSAKEQSDHISQSLQEFS